VGLALEEVFWRDIKVAYYKAFLGGLFFTFSGLSGGFWGWWGWLFSCNFQWTLLYLGGLCFYLGVGMVVSMRFFLSGGFLEEG
jgi:hypothetical protein